MRKISPPTGFDPQTVDLVASRYPDLQIKAVPLVNYVTVHLVVRVEVQLHLFLTDTLDISFCNQFHAPDAFPGSEGSTVGCRTA